MYKIDNYAYKISLSKVQLCNLTKSEVVIQKNSDWNPAGFTHLSLHLTTNFKHKELEFNLNRWKSEILVRKKKSVNFCNIKVNLLLAKLDWNVVAQVFNPDGSNSRREGCNYYRCYRVLNFPMNVHSEGLQLSNSQHCCV